MKMKIDPDGSLRRITSSVKDSIIGLKIIRTPDDQLKESEPFYKLVFLNKTDESASEKSDEEMFDEEIIRTENIFEKKESGKVYEDCDMNKAESRTNQEENNNTEYHNFYHRNHNFPERKNSSRAHQTFHPNPNDEKSYKKYNSAQRNSTTPSSSYSKHDIDPWIDSSIPFGQPANFAYPYVYRNVIPEPVRQIPVKSDKPGLLGDKPSATGIQNYSLNGLYMQNTPALFPSPTLPPVFLNPRANDPNWTQSYYDDSYNTNYSNYQRPVPDAPMPAHSRGSDYFQRKQNNNWRRNKPNRKNWNRGQDKSSDARRNPPARNLPPNNQFQYGNN